MANKTREHLLKFLDLEINFAFLNIEERLRYLCSRSDAELKNALNIIKYSTMFTDWHMNIVLSQLPFKRKLDRTEGRIIADLIYQFVDKRETYTRFLSPIGLVELRNLKVEDFIDGENIDYHGMTRELDKNIIAVLKDKGCYVAEPHEPFLQEIDGL